MKSYRETGGSSPIYYLSKKAADPAARNPQKKKKETLSVHKRALMHEGGNRWVRYARGRLSSTFPRRSPRVTASPHERDKLCPKTTLTGHYKDYVTSQMTNFVKISISVLLIFISPPHSYRWKCDTIHRPNAIPNPITIICRTSFRIFVLPIFSPPFTCHRQSLF